MQTVLHGEGESVVRVVCACTSKVFDRYRHDTGSAHV